MATNHKNAYPHFEPNQLLRSSTLNGYFAFLDEQTRLSRVHFLGCGIVEGLDFSWTEDALVINKGVAVNKDGWLVDVPDKSEYKYAVEVPSSETGFNSSDLKALLKDGGSHVSWICFPTEEDAGEFCEDPSRISRISELRSADFVVALAYGMRPEYESRCLHDHCDLNTAESILEPWPVLIPVDDVPILFQKMAPVTWAVSPRKEPALEFYHGDIQVFNEQVRSSALSWKSEVYDAMGLISSHFAIMDQKALDRVFGDSVKLLDRFNQAKARIQDLVDDGEKSVPDYVISFFDDMAQALNEFIGEYNVFAGKYGMLPDVIPEDLLVYLGRVDEGTRRDQNVYRSLFRNAVQDDFRKDAGKLSRMLERIGILAESYIPDASDERIVTKDFQMEKIHPGECLSSRPVPFYYDSSAAGFHDAWMADKGFAEGSFDNNSERLYLDRYLRRSGSMNEEGWSLYPTAYEGKEFPVVKNELEDLNKELRLSIDIVEAGLNVVEEFSAKQADLLLNLIKPISDKIGDIFDEVRTHCSGNAQAFKMAEILGQHFNAGLVESIRDGRPLSDTSLKAISEMGEVSPDAVQVITKAVVDVSETNTRWTDLATALLAFVRAWQNRYVSLPQGVSSDEIGKVVLLAPVKRGSRVFLFTAPDGTENSKKSKNSKSIRRTVLSYGVVFHNPSEVAVAESPATFVFRLKTAIQENGEYFGDLPETINPYGDSGRWDHKDDQLILYPYICEGTSVRKYETVLTCIDCKVTYPAEEIMEKPKIKFLDKEAVPAVILKMKDNGTAWVNLTIKSPEGGFLYQKRCTVIVNNPIWNFVPVSRVVVTPSSLPMLLSGPPQQLEAKVVPSDASKQEIRWKSNNSEIATVSSKGVVKPVKEGKTEILAISESDESKVGTTPVQVTSLSLKMRVVRKDGSFYYDNIPLSINPFTPFEDGAKWEFYNNESFYVCPFQNNGTTDEPFKTAKTNLVCVIENDRVLTVKQGYSPDSSTAPVFVLKMPNQVKGTAKVTFKILKANEVIYSRKITFDVHNPEWDKVPVTGVSLPSSKLDLFEGQTETLQALIIPDNAFNKKVTWTSSLKNFASIEETTGVLTAKSYGSTIVTVETDEGSFKKSMKVSVSSLLFRGELITPEKDDVFADLPDVIERGKWGPTGKRLATYMRIYPFQKLEKSLVKNGEKGLVQLPLDRDNLVSSGGVSSNGARLSIQVKTEDGKVPFAEIRWPQKGEYPFTLQIKDPKNPENILHSRSFTLVMK